MPTYCGTITRVGNKEGDMYVNSGSAMSTVRVSGKVSVIEIGGTVLRDVGCTNDIYDLLDPGRDACLYVHLHLLRKPIVLGVKYAEGNRKFVVGLGTIIASVIGGLIGLGLLGIAIAFLVGAVFGAVFGEGAGSIVGILCYLAILGFLVWDMAMMVKCYLAARAG